MLTMLAIYAGCLSVPEIANSGAKVVQNLFIRKRLSEIFFHEVQG